MRLLRRNFSLILIIVITGLAVWSLAQDHVNVPGIGERDGLRLGLDLSGGSHLVLEADLSNVEDADQAMKGVEAVLQRRVDAFGVTEPVITRQGTNRVIVQLPGVGSDEARSLVGRTALLDFRECTERVANAGSCPSWQPAMAIASNGLPRHLTGDLLLSNSSVALDQTNRPIVLFSFNGEGADMFRQITRRLIGQPLGIFLDDQVISAPTVQAIIGASGQITGVGTEEARRLSIQLNAGALPAPIAIVSESEVDAVLGEDSLDKSITAALVGLGVVLLFMVVYYKVPGLVASLALIIFTTIVLSTFKMIPVTLTLAGIAAFILSIGMAVDANILIFERMKEELRLGRTLPAAMDAGFARAWTSIRDSNVTTLITCAILFWFGSQPAFSTSLIRGFSLTLAISVVVSMFTAMVVTRTLMRGVIRSRLGRHGTFFLPLAGPD